jgi:hypothetical protein
MKSKTHILTICGCILITLFSCKKDDSQPASSESSSVDDAAVDLSSDSTLINGLVAWFPFNADTKDYSGHHNDVIYSTAQPVKGESGFINTAYKFDGVSSYMEVANSKSLNPSKITLFAFFKTKGYYQGRCHANRIINKGRNDQDYGRYLMGYDDMAYYNYQGCLSPVIDSLQNPYGTYGDGQGTASGATALSKYIQENKWYTMTYTYNGTYSKLYINGKLVSTVQKQTNFTPNATTLYFGRNEDPNYPYYFNGIIDEIRIYNRALLATEVQQLDYKVKH